APVAAQAVDVFQAFRLDGSGLADRRSNLTMTAVNDRSGLQDTLGGVSLGSPASIWLSDVTTGDTISFFITNIGSGKNSTATTLVFDVGTTVIGNPYGPPPPLVVLTDPSGEVSAAGGYVYNSSGYVVPGKTLQALVTHTNSSKIQGYFSREGADFLNFPDLSTTETFAQEFPCKYGFSKVGPIQLNDTVRIFETVPQASPALVMDQDSHNFESSNTKALPPMIFANSVNANKSIWTIAGGDLNTGSGPSWQLTDSALYVIYTYYQAGNDFSQTTTSTRVVKDGPLTITATFYNKDLIFGSAPAFVAEPVAEGVVPTLLIDRPGTGENPCCWPLTVDSTLSGARWRWSTTYNVQKGDRSGLLDGKSFITAQNAVDYGGNDIGTVRVGQQPDMKNDDFTIISTPARVASLTYSRGDQTQSPPKVPTVPFTITVAFDTRITQTVAPQLELLQDNTPVVGYGWKNLTYVKDDLQANQSIFTYDVTPALPVGDYTINVTNAYNLMGTNMEPSDVTPSNPNFSVSSLKATVTALTYTKAPAKVAKGALDVTVTFDMPVTGPVATIDRQPIGSGANDLPATAMTGSCGSTYCRTWTIRHSIDLQNGTTIKDGTAGITVTGALNLIGNQSDLYGNSFEIDTRPTVTLAYSRPSRSYGLGAFGLTATFTEDIPVAPTVAVDRPIGGLLVLPAVMPDSQNSRVWTVSGNIIGADGDGDRTVTITASAAAPADPGLASQPSNNTFKVDATKPTLDSVTYSKGGRPYKGGDPLLITATFSEEISPAAPSITITGGRVGGFLVRNASLQQGETATVWVFGPLQIIDGDADGTRTLSFSGFDAAGNEMVAPPASTFQIDNTRPQLTDFVYSKSSQIYKAETFIVTATFSEAITPDAPAPPVPAVLSPTITVSGGNLGGSSVNGQSMLADPLAATANTVWTFTTTILAANPNGERSLVLAAFDAAGNALLNQPNNPVFTVDTVAPTVANVDYSKSSARYGVNQPLALTSLRYGLGQGFKIDLAFSEEVNLDLTPTALSIAGGTASTANDVTTGTMAAGADHRFWSYARTILETGDDGTFTVLPTAYDAAGNPFVGPMPNNTFQVNTVVPNASVSYSRGTTDLNDITTDIPNRAVGVGLLTISAQYDKAIDTTTPPKVTINRPGTGNDVNAVGMDQVTAQNFQYNWTIEPDNNGSILDSGYNILTTLDIVGAYDSYDNEAVYGSAFRVDTIAPSISKMEYSTKLVAVAPSTVYITATFSEPIKATPNIAISGPPPRTNDVVARAMSSTGNEAIWTFVYNVVAGNDGTFVVAITNGKDRAGNANSALTANNQLTIRTQDVPSRSFLVEVSSNGLASRRTKMDVNAYNQTTRVEAGRLSNLPLNTSRSISLSKVVTGESIQFLLGSINASGSSTWTTSPFRFDTGTSLAIPVLETAIDKQTLADPSDEVVSLFGYVRNEAGSPVTGRNVWLVLWHKDPITEKLESYTFPAVATTQDYRGLFPGSYSFSQVGPAVPGDAIRMELVLPGGVVSWTPIFFPDATAGSGSNSPGFASIDGSLSRALVVDDFTTTNATRMNFYDPSLHAGITYSKDRTLVDTGPLQITVSFYNERIYRDGFNPEYYPEPIATTPALSIDRPGDGDRPCCYELSTVSGDPSVWTTTYQVTAANRTTIQDGVASVVVNNAIDYGDNNFAQSQANSTNTTFNTLTVPAQATIGFSKGIRTGTIPRIPAAPLTLTVTFDQQITQNSRPKVYITSTSSEASVNDVNGASLVYVSSGRNQSVFSFNYTPTATQPTGPGAGASLAGSYIVTPTLAYNLVGLENDHTPVQPIFELDTHRARPTISYSQGGQSLTTPSTVAAGDVIITARFDEPVQGPVILIDRPPYGGGINDVLQTPMTKAGSCGSNLLCDTWTYSYNVLTQTGALSNVRDGLAQVTIRNGVNEVGNSSEEPGVNNLLRIDTIKPKVDQVVAVPPRVAAGTSNLKYRVKFDEAMNPNVLPTISVRRPGTAPASVVTLQGPAADGYFEGTMSVAPQGSTPGLLDGLCTVTVLTGKDLAGNSVAATVRSTGYVITTPIVASLAFSPVQTSYGADQVITITSTFDRAPILGQPITSTAPALIVRRPTAGGATLARTITLSTSQPDVSTAKTWVATYQVDATDNVTYFDGTANIAAQVQDDVGNPALISGPSSFEIDGTSPTVRLTLSPSSPVTTGPLVIKAEFFKSFGGQPERLFTVPKVSITTSTVCTTTAGANTQVSTPMVEIAPFDGSVWTYSKQIQSHGGNDGCFEVHVKDGRDGSTNDNIDPAYAFKILTSGPSVDLTYIQTSGVPTSTVEAGPLTVTAVFTSDVASSSTPIISILSKLSSQPGPNSVLPTAMLRVDKRLYRYTYPLGIRTGHDGTFVVSVTGARDEAGNPNLTPALHNEFRVRTGNPTVYFTYSQDGVTNPLAVRAGFPVDVTASFSERIMPGTPQLSIAGAASNPSTGMTGTSTESVWTFPWT
ncbi:MAG: hypothetical protein HY814_00910, partial [Candidatus Riflebacteria bacterium]|nr:hypothetical protein [Candidatus Riflebacteria bacterium]